MISRIVGSNVKDHPNLFQEEVQMYVYEELVEGKKLTEIINTEHENVKYLKGFKLPENIVSSCRDRLIIQKIKRVRLNTIFVNRKLYNSETNLHLDGVEIHEILLRKWENEGVVLFL